MYGNPLYCKEGCERMSEIKDAKYRRKADEILWQDRKHHLWFPLSFTKYYVTRERLYLNSGFISSREDECLVYRILDITMTRSVGQRIFGTGTIEMNTKDRSTPVIRLVNIKHPLDVKRMLSDLIEEERDRKKVAGKDMYGSSAHYDPIEMEGHDFEDEFDHYYDR